MARKVMTREELQKWLTAEIKKIEGCEECYFGGVTPLKQPDISGCNWSENIWINATGIPSEIYLPAVSKVMIEARKKFNII